jgi:hypothetical protein
VNSPGEEVAGGSYCPRCEKHTLAHEAHAQVHGAHTPTRAMHAEDHEGSVMTMEWCV